MGGWRDFARPSTKTRRIARERIGFWRLGRCSVYRVIPLFSSLIVFIYMAAYSKNAILQDYFSYPAGLSS